MFKALSESPTFQVGNSIYENKKLLLCFLPITKKQKESLFSKNYTATTKVGLFWGFFNYS